MYQIEFDDEWNKLFNELTPEMKKKVWKKILQIESGLPGRHLRYGVDFFVEEVGQYRICYKSFEDKKIRRFYFVGNHKNYEKWIGLRK